MTLDKLETVALRELDAGEESAIRGADGAAVALREALSLENHDTATGAYLFGLLEHVRKDKREHQIRRGQIAAELAHRAEVLRAEVDAIVWCDKCGCNTERACSCGERCDLHPTDVDWRGRKVTR